MKHNERFWKTAEIVLGAIAAALLVLMLVLKLLGRQIVALTYPIVGVMILFLICDEVARVLRSRREKEEKTENGEESANASEPETALPKEAFETEEKSEESKS